MKLKPKNTATKQRALVYRRYNQIQASTKLDVAYRTLANSDLNIPVRYWVFDSAILDFVEIPSTSILPTTQIITVNILSSKNPYQYGSYFYTYNDKWYRFQATTDTSFSFSNEPITSITFGTRYACCSIYEGFNANESGTITIKNTSNVVITYIEALMYNSTGSSATRTILGGGTPLAVGEEREFAFQLAADYVVSFINIGTTENTKALSCDITFNGVTTFKFTDFLSTQFPKISSIAKYQKNAYYYAGSFQFMIRGSIEGTTTQYLKGNIAPLTSMNIKYFDDTIALNVDDLLVIDGRLYSIENQDTDIKYQPRKYLVHFATINSIL